MSCGKLLALAAMTSTVLLAAVAYGQTTQPAAPRGEELKPAVTGAQGTAAGPSEGGAKEGTGEGAGPTARPPGGFLDNPLLLIMLAFLVLLFFWTSRSRKKQEAKRHAMLAGIKKGDKVTSIGGIIGTVMEAREDEVVVKVDETNNVRMHFARWAIRGIGDESKAEKPEDKK